MRPDLDLDAQPDAVSLAAGLFALVMCGLIFFVGGTAFGALIIWAMR